MQNPAQSTLTLAELRSLCRLHAWELLRNKPPRGAQKARADLAHAVALLAWPDRHHERLRC